MATVHEIGGRLGDAVNRETREYVVRETPSESQALVDLLGSPTGPPAFTDSGLERQPPELTQRLRSDAFKFRVQFISDEQKKRGGSSSPSTNLELGEFSIHFDVNSQPEHIDTALETRAFKFGAGEDTAVADKLRNAIRQRGNGPNQVTDGADRIAPMLMFSLRAKIPRSTLRLSYAVAIRNLVGHTNDGPFPPTRMNFIDHQFDPGEVLFTAWVGDLNKTVAPSGATTDQYSIQEFHYLAGKNSPAGSFDFSSAMVAEAHDIIWNKYILTPGVSGIGVVNIAQFAIVNRIYDKADLGAPFA